jgi:hypothetical protein
LDDFVVEPGDYSIEVSGGRLVLRRRVSDPDSPWSRIKDYCQRDERWRNVAYSSSGSGTFGKYGCLITSLTSLATFAGYDVTPLTLAREIDKAGAFEGNYLRHPSKVTDAFPRLKWHYDYFLNGKLTSLVDWRNRPADIGVLAKLLQSQPVVVEVDFDGANTEIDQHFVLALGYRPDPLGGIDDELLILDPWTGSRTNLLIDYFNPKWMRDNTMKTGQTRVSRTVMGLRLWQPVLDRTSASQPESTPSVEPTLQPAPATVEPTAPVATGRPSHLDLPIYNASREQAVSEEPDEGGSATDPAAAA